MEFGDPFFEVLRMRSLCVALWTLKVLWDECELAWHSSWFDYHS